MRSELDVAYGRVAARVAVAEQMPIGPALLAELLRLQCEPMSAASAVRVQALWGKFESFVAARRMIATNEAVWRIGVRVGAEGGEEAMLAAQELACATHISYATARAGVGLVQRVGDCLPASWEALDRGELTLGHVKAVEQATRNCTPRVAEAVDAQVVALAIEREWTPGEVARAARKLVIALDPAGATARAVSARADADVACYPDNDEMATIVAHGPADRAQQIMAAIQDRVEAMSRDGDTRPVGPRRFDALHDLVTRPPATATDKRPHTRGEAQVRLDLTTILGLDEHPGELVGYGPISADTARRIAADSTLRRLVFDPLTGTTIDLGRKSYRPSAALRAAMEATHPACTMVGCARPAHTCEADHRQERRDGGPTDLANLKPLCKMHHQLKTKKLWRVDVNPDGSETFTSYLGFTYTKKPSYFPLPEPLSIDDDIPEEIADRLPDAFDPDPPHPDEPLPVPPPLTDEQYEEMERALDSLDAFGDTFRAWCDRHYDQARAVGLIV